MNRNVLLHHGTQMRDCVLGLYRNYPPQDAHEIVRRLVFEIGETVSDLHGRKEAGQLLYAAADACTAKLPIEDFRLPSPAASAAAVPEPPPAAVDAPKPWRDLTLAGKSARIIGTITGFMVDRLCLGFAIGLIARGPL